MSEFAGDLAIALRLLERKLVRVESSLLIYEEPGLGALGEIRPAWTTEELTGRRNFWGFEIAIAPWAERGGPAEAGTEDDEFEGVLIHELVHAATMERSGPICPHDGDGALCYGCQVIYYRDPFERVAKQAELAFVMGRHSRRTWSYLLRDPDPFAP